MKKMLSRHVMVVMIDSQLVYTLLLAAYVKVGMLILIYMHSLIGSLATCMLSDPRTKVFPGNVKAKGNSLVWLEKFNF